MSAIFYQKSFADFAPLKIGNTWVYRGSHQNSAGSNWIWKREQNQEELKVKVLTNITSGDTNFYTVAFSDSLFTRQLPLHDSTPGSYQNLKDTVIKITKTYFDLKKNPILRMQKDIDGSIFTTVDPFFSNHDSLGRNFTPLVGPKPGFNVMEGNWYGQGSSGWIIDNYGIYWFHNETTNDGCGTSLMIQNLILSTFNGNAVDIGFSPPIPALPKISQTEKVTCKIIQRKNRAMVVRANQKNLKEMDMIGRELR